MFKWGFKLSRYAWLSQPIISLKNNKLCIALTRKLIYVPPPDSARTHLVHTKYLLKIPTALVTPRKTNIPDKPSFFIPFPI